MRLDSLRKETMKETEQKQILCRMVKATKIVPKNKNHSIADITAVIEFGSWLFPCESYSHRQITENLEKAICGVLNLESIEVTDFQTDIVEYP